MNKSESKIRNRIKKEFMEKYIRLCKYCAGQITVNAVMCKNCAIEHENVLKKEYREEILLLERKKEELLRRRRELIEKAKMIKINSKIDTMDFKNKQINNSNKNEFRVTIDNVAGPIREGCVDIFSSNPKPFNNSNENEFRVSINNDIIVNKGCDFPPLDFEPNFNSNNRQINPFEIKPNNNSFVSNTIFPKDNKKIPNSEIINDISNYDTNDGPSTFISEKLEIDNFGDYDFSESGEMGIIRFDNN